MSGLDDLVASISADPNVPPGCILVKTENDWVLSAPDGTMFTRQLFENALKAAIAAALKGEPK